MCEHGENLSQDAARAGHRNPTEYGHVNSVQVTAKLAMRGLSLGQALSHAG